MIKYLTKELSHCVTLIYIIRTGNFHHESKINNWFIT